MRPCWATTHNTGIAINRNLHPLKVDPTRELTAVGLVASTLLLLYVNAELPAKSVAELVGPAMEAVVKRSGATVD